MKPNIEHYFLNTNLLATLCDQNGWIDEDSLQITLLEQKGLNSIYEIRFEEILKEGSGCECGRNDCWGKIELTQSSAGEVINAQIIAGLK